MLCITCDCGDGMCIKCKHTKGEERTMRGILPRVGNLKQDKGKLDWALLPIGPLREIVKVFMYGVEKYERDNWQTIENHRDKYYNATMRHLTDWYEGRKKDKDSKL